MEIKVKKAVGSSDRTVTSLDLGLDKVKLPEAAKTRIKNDVGQYLVESILSSAQGAKSPVEGESWPVLSDAYKKKKVSEGFSGRADLEAEGDLLDALKFEGTSTGIDLGWFGKEAAKADGHNNLSGASRIPTRRTLPDVGQEFVSRIQKEAEQIVSDAITDALEFDASDFSSVTSKTSLYEALSDYFPDLSRAEIRAAITRAPQLVAFLDDEGLFDLL